ncbi:hypothetical protein QFZ20_002054 [Flavobacterium sp. W4I14]|nr:hypothetical protein [Flavobacterium sp. W4I14]
MFKFKENIKPGELNKILEMKTGQTQSGLKNLDLSEGAPTNLVLPHDTYMVELSSLKQSTSPTAKISGMRIIDANKENFKSIYDLNFTTGGNLEPQHFQDQSYVKNYQDAFDKLFHSKVEPDGYEVRSLKIPSLHLEAIWLHKEGGTDDLYILTSDFEQLSLGKTYREKEFFETLQQAAKDYDTEDNEIGG